MRTLDIPSFIKRYWGSIIANTIGKNDTTIYTKQRGCEVFDSTGKRYLDFCSQAGVSNIGHLHPLWVEAMFNYIRSMYESVAVRGEPGDIWYLIASDFHFRFDAEFDGKKIEISQPALAELLKKHTFGEHTRFIQQVSGVTTNNAAIKFVQKVTGRQCGFAFEGAFQGRQGTGLACTHAKPIQRQGFLIDAYVKHFPFVHDKATYRMAMNKTYQLPMDDYGFIIFELLQGEGGVEPANGWTIKFLNYLQKEHDIVLIDDEIQEGFGRTGKWFAFDHFDLIPDIVTISKSMGSGDPIGAGFFNSTNRKFAEWEDIITTGWDSSTFQWNPHAVFNSIITIKIIEKEGLIEKAALQGNYLRDCISAIVDEFHDRTSPHTDSPLWYLKHKYLGLHHGIEFRKLDTDRDSETFEEYIPDVEFRDRVFTRLHENGIMTLSAGNPKINPTIRFMPPLVVSNEEIEEFGEALRKSLWEAVVSLGRK